MPNFAEYTHVYESDDKLGTKLTAILLLSRRNRIIIKRKCSILQYGGYYMPSIIPVSDLKNYASVVNQVSYGNRVYLTKNGHGQCALIDMAELDELDKQKALLHLMTKLSEAKASVIEEGTISADELEKELGL